MKKLLTLLLAVFSLSAVNAQSSADRAKGVIRGERRDYDPARSDEDEKKIIGGNRKTIYDDGRYRSENDNRVDTDREHNAKIRSIRNNPKLSRYEKDRIIRGLETERNRRIRASNDNDRNNRRYAEYSKEKSRYNKEKNYKNKKDKGNNGKHLGWQKGKNNPHNRNSSKK